MSPDTPATFTPLVRRATGTETASGYSAGYAAGWAAGARAAAAEGQAQQRRAAQEDAERAQRQAADAERAVLLLAQAARAARERVAPVLEEAQNTLAGAVVELAEALLGAELADGPTSARAALARAASLGAEDVVRVRMHPEDLVLVRTTLAGLPGELGLPEGVELVGDGALNRGDAVSELAEGYLDARLSTAVQRVKDALGTAP